MRSVVIERPGSISVTDIPELEIGPEDILVRVGACGICGTDLHIADGARVAVDPSLFCGYCDFCRRGEGLKKQILPNG